ncbi:hypothetical protein [Paenibacillus taichungensis]
MSKFKEFIKKVTSKFSTPVKPLAAEVFEEEKFKMDIQGNVKATQIKISENGIQITSDNGISLNMGIPSLPIKPEMIDTPLGTNSIKKKTVKHPDLNRRMKKTKSNRIKKKIQKRFDAYGKIS